MIIGFGHKGLEAFYMSGSKKGIQAIHALKLARILAALDAAAAPGDFNLPAFRLHALKGELVDHWSVWVDGHWRVTFRFATTDIELVDYLDYH